MGCVAAHGDGGEFGAAGFEGVFEVGEGGDSTGAHDEAGGEFGAVDGEGCGVHGWLASLYCGDDVEGVVFGEGCGCPFAAFDDGGAEGCGDAGFGAVVEGAVGVEFFVEGGFDGVFDGGVFLGELGGLSVEGDVHGCFFLWVGLVVEALG